MVTPRLFTLSAIMMSAPAMLTEAMGALCRRRALVPMMSASVLAYNYITGSQIRL